MGPTPVVTVGPTTTPPVGAAATSAVQLVDVATAMALAADPSVIVVDVRTPAEFAEGHISRAVLADIEDPGFGDRIAQLDRSTTYLVYCHSGNRSGQATAVMAALGFTSVANLDGGISAWVATGAPVVT
ncbi:MAG: rhodanese-like domain-containing protein [Ilumatobacteraceae bacterium]